MKHTKKLTRRSRPSKIPAKMPSRTKPLTIAILSLGLLLGAEVATIGFVQGDGLRANTYGPLPVYQDTPFVPVPNSKVSPAQCRRQARKEKWTRKHIRECIRDARRAA